ncbi:Nucleolar protein 16 [Coemansia aciculifera]|uniref:Nucleolar protein 16 n=1 Tax=Coemansia aciculifera TaxID=417176 RepID=A0ACC1MAZ8_9FUNG|nr:Nucleolar protein 16 [Coemansia aciculifera]
MVRPIARKKQKNPGLKTTRRRANKLHTKKYTGHPLLRDKWDVKLTVSENYRNLGLVSRLNGVSGGIVKNILPGDKNADTDDVSGRFREDMTEAELRKAIPQGYGIIERDDDGNVVNIIMAAEPADPLDDDYEVEVDSKPKKEGARILEEYANTMDGKKERWVSVGERRKLQDFIDRHGEDYDAMFWDKELNLHQLTKRQIQKKIEKYLVEKDKALGPAYPHLK